MLAPIDTRFPEEIDVFVTPHKRMKALVDVYIDQLLHTDFHDEHDLKSFLKNLDLTFSEFKLHEYIENEFIIKKLRKRFLELSIQNSITSDGHHDLQFINLIQLVHEGFSKAQWSEEELNSYQNILQRYLKDFTHKFIPHMKEEEEIFQPLLMKYFDYEELKNLKSVVIKEHENRLKSNSLDSQCSEDELDSGHVLKSDGAVDLDEANDAPINQLPDELMLAIFNLMDANDLYSCVQVCKQWSRVACDHSLWFTISPLQWLPSWSHTRTENDYKNADMHQVTALRDYLEQESGCQKNEYIDKYFVQFIHSFLPNIGPAISVINFCSANMLSTTIVNGILKQCPNVISLNLCNARIHDHVFKGCSFGNLTYLSLAYCSELTDVGIESLAKAIVFSRRDSKVNRTAAESICKDFNKYILCDKCALVSKTNPYPLTWHYTETNSVEVYLNSSNLQELSLNGCENLTDKSIMALTNYEAIVNVTKLDLSGCWNFTSSALDLMSKKMAKLEARHFHYCCLIDGPLSDEANGCENLDDEYAACCIHN
ncbi:F-box/LRR-repeat protein 5 [Nymphon striatum]|nr:F-box/LRR-repeat protein 5 [Nymphon striatum]